MAEDNPVARIAFFISTVICCCQGVANFRGEYIATGTCSKEDCVYSYSATQTSVVGESRASLQFRADVESICESVGVYQGIKAIKLCAVLKNTAIASGGVYDDGKANLKGASETANYLLSGPFCFVQTSEGKIVSVHYGPDEKPAIVNLKKAVAAAFQANFKYTEQEVEEDTLTTHVSQYSYENLGPDHWIMRRTVKPSDVIRFASNEMHRKSRLEVQKAEIVEYKEGVLLKSSGTLFVNAKGPMDTQDDAMAHFTPVDVDQASYDATAGSNELYGTGTYSLVLKKRYQNPTTMTKLRRSATQFLLSNQSSLSALDEIGESTIEAMKNLRAQMPSILMSLAYLHKNATDAKIGYKIKRLLILESKNGPLPGYAPARDEVIRYLQKLSSSTAEMDVNMKLLLYSFLAVEGSIESQKLLVKAINESKDSKERNALIVQLAFVPKVNPYVLSLIEDMIKSSNTRSDPLVLTYGALASSLSPQLQSRALQFLRNCTDRNDDDTYVHLIHAMGNMESNLTDEHLINSLSHDNPSVRLAAIYALRHRTEWPEVQRSLLHTLLSFPSKDVTDMILKTLIAGAECSSYPETVNDFLFTQLLAATESDVEQSAMLARYVRLLGPTSPKDWIQIMSSRNRRGTNWNEDKKLYDLVLDYNTRGDDVRSYPSHKAYLWAKSIGNSKIMLDAAFGAFVGFGAGNEEQKGGFKLFAKGVVRGSAFGHSKTAFEALILSENKHGSGVVHNQVYLSILGKVFLEKNKEITSCSPWKISPPKPLYFPLLDFRSKVFICIGFVNFKVTVDVKLKLEAGLTACVGECISGEATLTPTIGLIATGEGSVSLAEIMKGGIDVRANLNYALTLKLTGSYKLRNGPANLCVTLSHSWLDNSIDVYPYYQYKIMQFIDVGGFRILSGFQWGEKKIWKLLAVTFNLPSTPWKKLWTSCDTSTLQCPIATMY
ncbi:hypothetical protein EMCRGX_G009395 [Ephydatia muelleri]